MSDNLIEPLTVPLGQCHKVVRGHSRTRFFEAVRVGALTVRIAGKARIVEVDELKRYLKSLPTKGRPQDAEAPAAA